jgi:hypothetical protein
MLLIHFFQFKGNLSMPFAAVSGLNLVFYSHPWSVLHLADAGVVEANQAILVELAETSLLSHLFGSRRAPHNNLADVLSRGQLKRGLAALFAGKQQNPFHGLIETFPGLPLPIVLAPAHSTPAAVQTAALVAAASLASGYGQITVLLNYEEAIKFSAIFDYVDKFHFLWDIADLPGIRLTELSRILVDEHGVTPQRWGGFHLCQHQFRNIENADDTRLAFQRLIDAHIPSPIF